MSIWECGTAAVSVIGHAVYARAHDIRAAVTVRNLPAYWRVWMSDYIGKFCIGRNCA